MASKQKKTAGKDDSLRKQILKSAVASFKIEGIEITHHNADVILKKVELNLGKQSV